ncbi:MAG: hypothetical protein A2770_03805 [Candidatus Levybacteria bacterium RIFCSPHIGHO2_01_FULL_38_12]|nr:MAG: hypothetical protein A2770_03805 [Candidatus Levybacteria bacterium RIFCSPHIGHO2_01_FULL_38_12]
MKIGFIGLGKMGSRMVFKLLKEGHEVVVWNRSPQPVEELRSQLNPKSEYRNSKQIQNTKYKILNTFSEKLIIAGTIEELVRQLQSPRIVWCMVTAGEATRAVLDELLTLCSKDDIAIDGGNAHFRDTEERFKQFKNKGIRFLGIGVSGGVIAAHHGYPLMAGGDECGYEFIKPILDSLAKPHGGHEYFGSGGAGHFVKMIHNGIEYGFMQSLGEGFGVLQKAEYKFDLLKVARLYQKGTLVSGFMLDRTVEVFDQDKSLEQVLGVIEESGEAKWTVEEAENERVPVPIIKGSLEFRRQSQTNPEVQNSFAAKLVADLRQAFGGHGVKEK